jgi:hypothetical protein
VSRDAASDFMAFQNYRQVILDKNDIDSICNPFSHFQDKYPKFIDTFQAIVYEFGLS